MATELVKADQLNASFQGMTQLPVVRQVGLLVGLAASIALGVYVVLWSRTPDYSVLYHQVSTRDAGDIVNVLQQQNIAYKVDTDTGMILVDSSKLHKARMALAAQDLPHSSGDSFDLIEKDQGFGTSDFIQNARYQRALEGEMARTIMAISSVENARVHLALPKESAFLADKRKPSASVFINLAPGRRLSDEQVSAIIHLVASSVPDMDSNEVTLVDNKGHLLSRTDAASGIGLSTRQLEYKQKVEGQLASNIENILLPIVGPNKVRAQVVASMDFTQMEMTSESYDPDSPAVRSEQRVEEHDKGSAALGGVPGALSNQPPGAATAPQQAKSTTTTTQVNGNQKSQVRYTINNELDRSIVHRRRSPGAIKRLSVAVVVDHKMVKNAKGELVSTAYTQDELNRFTTLVKEAVGFDAIRGDSVNVINAEFSAPPTIGPAPPTSFFDKPWVWDVGKQVLGGLLAALVLFGVLRPVMRNLASVPARKHSVQSVGGEGDGLDEDQVSLSGEQKQRIPKPNEYESDLEMAKAMVVQEPKRVAQVVKQWVNEG